jgi:hypothetical protein
MNKWLGVVKAEQWPISQRLTPQQSLPLLPLLVLPCCRGNTASVLRIVPYAAIHFGERNLTLQLRG